MSYRIEIDPRARAAGRLIGDIRQQLAAMIEEERAHSGLPKRALARKLGIRQSVLTKILSGESTLTLRSLAEISWALERRVNVRFQERERPRPGSNSDGAWTDVPAPTVIRVAMHDTCSTLPSAQPILCERKVHRERTG